MLNQFTKAYIEALFFTECEDGTMSFDDVAPETLQHIIEDCTGFELLNRALLDNAGNPQQNGHDFWLTRNGHGAGFWDRGYGDIGDKLTKACKSYANINAYKGDDGKVYLE